MPKKAKVSVVTTLYNAEDYIEECVLSVQKQDYTDIEHIIVDDCSTDSSSEIVERLQKKYSNIKLIKLEKNVGTYAAANIGIDKAGGEYIARLDSDDVCCVDRISTQVKYLDQNRSISLVGAQAIKISSSGAILEPFNVPITYGEILGHIYINNAFIHSSIMMRKADFLEVGKYDEKRKSQDYGLFLKFVTAGKEICNLDRYLVLYRKQEKSLTSTNFEEQQRLVIELQYQYLTKELNLDITKEEIIRLRLALFQPEELTDLKKTEKLKLIKNLKRITRAVQVKYPKHPEVIVPLSRIRYRLLGNIMGAKRTYYLGKIYFRLLPI